MTATPLSIKGAWLIHTERHLDSRGEFREVFRKSNFSSDSGVAFEVKQFNRSISYAGVVRGIHGTMGPGGQSKYVTCPFGAILDVVVDLRTDSATFGKWHAEELTPETGKAMFIEAGLGHAFLALKDQTIVEYLCSEEYSPTSEFTVNPLDETIGIKFEKHYQGQLKISDKDLRAPHLADAILQGLLPR